MVGVKGPPIPAPEPVERGAIRRFVQAIMDPDPLYSDESYAISRFGFVVAPPLFPLHACDPSCRQPLGSADPLEPALTDPDFDGAGVSIGVWNVDVGLARQLNGGNDVDT